MPRYRYKCSECEEEAIVYHLSHEQVHECLACRSVDTMVKQLTIPQYRNKKTSTSRIGDLTKEFIEINREVLEDEKNKREDFDDSA
tara:strand:- start:447 stop:704 length:258 start_codon:yes stop_codon:yes gene_type:complete